MEIDITGRHFRVSDSLKEYALEKIKKLSKYSLKLEVTHIVFEAQKFYYITEITVLGKGMRLSAKERSTDMHAAFDKCFSVIQLQLRKQHEKLKDHKGRRYAAESETA